MSILLVCERPLLAHALSNVIQKYCSVECDVCNEGNAALKVLHRHKYELLITEILLPYHSGIELINYYCLTMSLDRVLILASFKNDFFLKRSLNAKNCNFKIINYFYN